MPSQAITMLARCKAHSRSASGLKAMKIDIDDFRVREDSKVKLDEWPTDCRPYYKSKSHYQQLLASHIEQLSELQPVLYADNRFSLLIIFQAMDAAGKDSVLKHVMSGVN